MSAVRKEITTDAGGTVRIDSYPASEKVYIQGSRADIRVPMRKITLSDTQLISVRKKTRRFMFMTHPASTLIPISM